MGPRSPAPDPGGRLMLTNEEAQQVARAILTALSKSNRERVKAVHVYQPSGQEAELHLVLLCRPRPEEPCAPYVFLAEEVT